MEGAVMNINWFHKAFLFSSFLGFFLVILASSVEAQDVQVYRDGPIHEAFITPSTGNNVVIQGISNTPPPEINEQIPPKCHDSAIWIRGYWAWDVNLNDFIWVSGVWRRPPPEHFWIPGYWKQFDSSWGWIRGFWSQLPEKDLKYINDTPPDPKQEVISNAPNDNSFWLSGYWEYNEASAQYRWLRGQWVDFSPDWVYVPAYYLWRPGGYIFIPGYWDYPLEVRGCAYISIRVAPEYRSTIIYTPAIILDVEYIMTCLIGYYPDYTIFFWHYWHFHPGFWGGWCCTPPWWEWGTCWCFNSFDSWWLWWWWLHDGFPAPPWLLAAMAENIPPPSPLMLEKTKNVVPNPLITPWGVISPKALIDALPGKEPVMPADPDQVKKIIDSFKPKEPPSNTFRPSGTKDDLKKPLPRPDMGQNTDQGDGVATPPPPPTNRPPVVTQPPSNSSIPRPITPPIDQWNPPGYAPLPPPPQNVIPPQVVPRPRGPRPWNPPHYEPPVSRPRPDREPPHGGRPWTPKPSYPPPSSTEPPSRGEYQPGQSGPSQSEIKPPRWSKPSRPSFNEREFRRGQVQQPWSPPQQSIQGSQRQIPGRIDQGMYRSPQSGSFQPRVNEKSTPKQNPNKSEMY